MQIELVVIGNDAMPEPHGAGKILCCLSGAGLLDCRRLQY